VQNRDREALVQLLQKNHDVVMEKYELLRQRNDMLEKNSLDKERLYNDIKSEMDKVANVNHKL